MLSDFETSVDTSGIITAYHEETRKIYIRLISVVAILTFLFIPFFIFTDMTYVKLPAYAAFWRASPMVVFLAILVLLKTKLGKSYTAVHAMVITGIVSLFVMMYSMCIIAEIYRLEYLPSFIAGSILFIAVTFAVLRGGYRVILPIYLVTFIPFLIIFLYYWSDGERFRGFMKFVNTFFAMAGFSVLSEWIERLRFKEFRMRSTLLLKNKIIEEKASIIDNELELARMIQTDLMPATVPAFQGIRFTTCYRPMQALAGDFFDFIRFKENDLIGIFISDVSGHGMPASLITSMVKVLLHSIDEKKLSPSQCLEFINSKITGLIRHYFVTAIYAVYHVREKTLNLSRAGHPYPIMVRNGSVKEIISNGKLLGVFPALHLEEEKVQLQAGDRVFFLTDGLLEAKDKNNKEFREILYNGLLPEMTERPHSNPAESLFNEMVRFTGGEPLKDDVCIICMEVLD